MKRTTVLIIALALMSVGPLGVSFAQGRGGGGGGGRMYDLNTVQTLSGTVLKVESTRGRRGRAGVHLLLKTDKEEIGVHLGPASYLDKQAVKIAAQDTVEVHGSRITYEGKPALIAAEVSKAGQVLKLRDANGVPAWSGQGRRAK